MVNSENNLSQMKSQFEPSEIGNAFQRSGGAGQQIFLITIFLFSFALGAIRYEIADSKPLDANLENNIGEKVFISGIISDEPTKKEKQAQLVVDFKDIVIRQEKNNHICSIVNIYNSDKPNRRSKCS